MISAGYHVRLVGDWQGLNAITGEWKRVVQKSKGARNCYLHDPHYYREFLSRQSADSRPLVVVVEKEDLVRAIAPFWICNGGMPCRLSVFTLFEFPMRRLRLLSGELILADGENAALMHELIFTAVAASGAFDIVDLQDVPDTGMLWQFVNRLTNAQSGMRLIEAANPQTCHQIRFASNFEQYLGAFKSRDRKNLLRRKRHLHDAFQGGTEVTRISTADQVSSFLEAVDKIFNAAWQSRVYGVQHRNSKKSIAYFQFLAQRGWLRSYLLSGQGQALAYQIGIQDGDTYHFVETGYDSRWSNLGVGTVLEFSVIEDLFRINPPKTGDFGFGDAEYKRIFGNESHCEFEHVFLTSQRSLYARAAVSTIAATERVEASARKLLKWTGTEQIVRKLVKRRRSPGPLPESGPISPES